MGDYASKGLANGIGIPALALGSIAFLNQMNGNCGCNGGLLGGLFGNNNCNRGVGAELQYVSSLQAENAMLKSENYSDKVAKEVYMQTLADNKSLRDEMTAYIKPLAEEAANNRVNIATLQAQQKSDQEKAELREQIVLGKINEVGLVTAGKFSALDQTIGCIQNTLSGITKTIVPLCSVCPQPMQRYNSFTAPTTLATDCGGGNLSVSGSVAVA